jgi:prepilin-type N-terminal cleavage/methylation domain-containing protein
VRVRIRTSRGGFTLIELLIVMAIIIVLAGLILATSGYVQDKGKRSRAEAEIAAMSAALESYKADNGIYPTDPGTSEVLNPAAASEADCKNASRYLYGELSGDRDWDGTVDSGGKSYMAFKPGTLQRPQMQSDVSASNRVAALRDPFGHSYGYSTLKATTPAGTAGYNPTFDLWSVAGGNYAGDQSKWIKNW